MAGKLSLVISPDVVPFRTRFFFLKKNAQSQTSSIFLKRQIPGGNKMTNDLAFYFSEVRRKLI